MDVVVGAQVGEAEQHDQELKEPSVHLERVLSMSSGCIKTLMVARAQIMLGEEAHPTAP
jgi:Mg2+/Co2+ transporter CorC